MPKHSLFYTVEEKCESFGELLSSFLDGASREKIQRIWAVSAYYDKDSIRQLIKHIENRGIKKPELFIVIGTINNKELKVLQKIQKTEIGTKFKEGSGIRVTNCGRLFHSKGYLVETSKNRMCAIGSMNLTQNGLNKNEEILTYSRYADSEATPPLVESFKKYVKTWRSSNRSKEIGAVSEGEEGILWLPENKARNNAHDKFRQKNPEFPDNLSGPAVQQYFKKLGLHKLNNPKLNNEKKFTLDLYKLLFQECRFRPESYKHDGATLRSSGAGWRSGVGYYRASKHVKAPKPKKNKRHFAYSAHFDVTSASLPNQTYHCDVWIYLDTRSSAEKRLTSFLNVRVEDKQKKRDNLQLYVSKPGWKNIQKGQYWKIYHDGSMGAKKDEKRIKQETVLSKVHKFRRDHWIKTPSWSEGKEVVHLGNLPIAKKAPWKNFNSKIFLARLLHYAVIRADIKFSDAK